MVGLRSLRQTAAFSTNDHSAALRSSLLLRANSHSIASATFSVSHS
jgi:hypothetical protein